MSSNTSTVITVPRFYDLWGNTIVEGSGNNDIHDNDRYEVIVDIPSGNIGIEAGDRVSDVIISGNTIVGCADNQLHSKAHSIVIEDNMLKFGKAHGMYAEGTTMDMKIVNNVVAYHGETGIKVSNFKGGIVSQNLIQGFQTVDPGSSEDFAGIHLSKTQIIVSNNIIDGDYTNGNGVLTQYGIIVADSSSNNNAIRENQIKGLSTLLTTYDVYVEKGIANTYIYDNNGTTIGSFGAGSGENYDLITEGSGDPTSSVPATQGSIYKRSNTTTQLYVYENTTWVGK